MFRAIAFVAISCLMQVAQAGPVPGQGTWETSLHARDLDSNGTVDAYYDSDLNITWLKDADLANTSGYVPPSGYSFSETFGSQHFMYLDHANEWAAQLVLGGTGGWRLPQATGDCGPVFSGCPIGGELVHMLTVTLGGLNNSGPFDNLLNASSPVPYYQSGNLLPCWNGGGCIGVVNFVNGAAFAADETGYGLGSWTVHDGDVGVSAVPEPATYGLMGIGLAFLALARRKAGPQQSS